MTESLSLDQAAALFQQMVATLPKRVGCVVIFTSLPANDLPGIALKTFTTHAPDATYHAIAEVLRRYLDGESMTPEILGPRQ